MPEALGLRRLIVQVCELSVDWMKIRTPRVPLLGSGSRSMSTWLPPIIPWNSLPAVVQPEVAAPRRTSMSSSGPVYQTSRKLFVTNGLADGHVEVNVCDAVAPAFTVPVAYPVSLLSLPAAHTIERLSNELRRLSRA